MLQFPLLQQPAGVRDDGHRLEVRKRGQRSGGQQKLMDSCGQDAESNKRCKRNTTCTADDGAVLRREGSVLCHPHCSPAQSITELRQGNNRGLRMNTHSRMVMLEFQVLDLNTRLCPAQPDLSLRDPMSHHLG